ncbi:GLPGLI family protein [Emticicia sp. SJ17W-69]|uniref:GLPGLI family protein n=1 Tax=Emticicia sp. SJ17W-69 TaxID=3421657 RepID=UPI003EBB03A8
MKPFFKSIAKVTFGTLLALIYSQFSFAQSQEGVIEFEFKVNMHKSITMDNEQMKSMIPEFRTSKNRLFFKPNASFYTNVEEEDQEINTTSGGANVQMKFNRPQQDIYRNFDNTQYTMLTDFAGKKFRVEDSLKTMAWKFVDETKKIAGYDCKKATYHNDETKQDIVAWFTDALVCSSGPQNYWGLPGMILGVDINDGLQMITAQKVTLTDVSKDLKVPTGGKKVTAKEFKKIRDDYMKEMGIKDGGPGGARIIIRNN